MPAWSTCPRAHVSTRQKRANLSFLRANVPVNMPKHQRAKGVPVVSLWVLTCHKCANSLIWHSNVPKGAPIFRLFFNRVFYFLNFSIMIYIYKFQEYLRNKEFEFWHLQNFIRENLINLKPLISFLMEHVGLTKQLFG